MVIGGGQLNFVELIMIKRKQGKSIVMLGTAPEAHGGIATVVGNYRESGVLKKWKVMYFATHVQGSAVKKAHAAALAMFQLLHMLITRRVALLHLHMSSRASTWRKSCFVVVGMMFRVPYLVHLHSPDFLDFFEHECGKRRKWLIRFVFSNATYVVALSSSWATEVRRIAPDARTAILFNSVPLPAIKLAEEEEYGVDSAPPDPPMILFLGAVGKRKGVFDLIKAASMIKGSFRLIIGGNGELQKARALSEELGVSQKIQFVGWLGKAEKDRLLARAAIFVLPSYNEGMPMAILEAMSWAVPVITTPVGGIPEVIVEGQDGLLVNPGDALGLARALERLLAEPQLRRKLGETGRRKIKLEYSMEVLQPQLEQLWINAGIPGPKARVPAGHISDIRLTRRK